MLNIENRDSGDNGTGKSSRRLFLVGTGAAVASLFGLGALVQNTFRKKGMAPASELTLQEPEVIVDDKIYREGDMETPIAHIKVDGWKLLFNELDITRSNWQMTSDNTNYDFTIRCAEGHQHGHLGFSSSNGNLTLGDALETHKIPDSSIVTRYASGYYSLQVLPHYGPMTLRLALSDSGRGSLEEMLFSSGGRQEPKPTKVYSYTFEPKIHTYGPETKDDEIRIVAERQIAPGLLRTVHDIHRIFSAYKKPSLVYIIDEETKRIEEARKTSNEAGEYKPLKDFVLLTTDNFLRPDFAQQGEQIACHELAHNIMQYARFEGEENTALARLKNTFEQIKERADGNDKKYPAFAVFREATYKGTSKSGIDSIAGHPWDNAGEFFASAVTTFRYFSRGFVRNYHTLTNDYKNLVRGAALNVLDFLRAMNPSERDLRQLIPNVDGIRYAMNSP